MIEYQARIGNGSVPACEAVEYLFSPASIRVRCQLEDNATSSSPAKLRGAIEISTSVEDQTVEGEHTPVAIDRGEPMQDVLRPASVRVRCQLENHAAAVSVALTKIAAVFCRAVKIPCLIEDQAGNKRGCAVAARV